jgi:hypothetical protein
VQPSRTKISFWDTNKSTAIHHVIHPKTISFHVATAQDQYPVSRIVILPIQQVMLINIITNESNEYFASIASKMNEEADQGIKLEPLTKFTDFISKQNPNSIFMADCTNEEISEIICRLQNGKASDFPIRVIKKLSHFLSPALKRHFNHLMTIGHFPAILKIGRISPICKKDDEELL